MSDTPWLDPARAADTQRALAQVIVLCLFAGVDGKRGAVQWMRSDARINDDTLTQTEVMVDADKRARKAVLRARPLRYQARSLFSMLLGMDRISTQLMSRQAPSA